jgi:hypothetical protein
MKQTVDSICRMCYNAEEHIRHIVSGRTTIATPEYANRRRAIWKHMGLRVTDRYCEHTPGRVLNVNGATIMWDIPVITDSTIVANQPDIVLHNKIGKKCLLNEIAIPNDSNVNTKKN